MSRFTTTDSSNAETTTWLTPLPIVKALGEFDLDPCGYPNHETAKKLICLPECGLKASWQGRVWLNPPYGREAALWMKRLKEHGNGIALIFARLETKWIQEFLENGFFSVRRKNCFYKSCEESKGKRRCSEYFNSFW